ncbi:MAG: Ig-like domain-containing protein [Promethearchaeota archaeon]|jgi:hypothetical protein
MKKKTKRSVILLFLFFLGMALLNRNLFNYNLNDKNFKQFEDQKDGLTNPNGDQIKLNFGGYSTSNSSQFTVIENATSTLSERNFSAKEGNYFDVATPENWNISLTQFNIQSYSKEQKFTDSTFDIEQDLSPWNDEDYDTGRGYFSQTFEPDDEEPDYVRTQIYNSDEHEKPGFKKGNYALWSQTLTDINPDSLDIAEGDIIQEIDETTENFNYFEEDPSFFKDTKYPYGGEYDPVWDLIELVYDDVAEALRVIVVPHQSMLGGNPSAAWWYFLNLPYAVEYAQVTLTWSIDEDSSFESEDEYEVKARINNKYIDGTKWISKEGDVPFNGSNDALMVYSNEDIDGRIFHNSVSRTYNITDLIDGLIGINKFDFGIWAKNPSHGGDLDIISAKFESIEFMFNTSNQYETASLEFDYKCIDEDGNTINPFIFENNASIFMVIDDLKGSIEMIRVLPFSMMTINPSSFSSTPWTHVDFSVSEKYIEILKNNDLSVKIGIIFEENYYNRIYYRHYLDNVYFNINYKHPDVIYSNLQMNIDDSWLWEDLTNNIVAVNTSGWVGGDIHKFQFRSNLPQYQDNLYLNLKSTLKVFCINYNTTGAVATYKIHSANSEYGIWDMIFNNTFSYNKLVSANSTPFFNTSYYSIAYLEMPAFDFNGSQSLNWEVFNAIAPNRSNHSQNIYRFNSSLGSAYQNCIVLNAFQSGNWTLQAKQRNYIINCTFNSTSYYESFPAFYKNEVLEYNFTLLEDSLNGNYSVSLLNSTGSKVGGFPKYYTSNSQNVVGSLDILENYKVGRYYLNFKWNDTGESSKKTMRYGSHIKSFYILNATQAGFISKESSVSSGDIANFTVFYRTYNNWGIQNATIHVFENSTGNWRLWGKAWTGTYQIGSITYIGDGNYSIPLFTSGAPNGTYTLRFSLFKLLHQPRALITSLDVIAINNLDIDIVWGAYLNPFSQYVINDNNIPFVNDTINSRIQINITDQSTKTPITEGLVLGTIGNVGTYFEALEIGGGLYNLTLDTRDLNATNDDQNETLFIRCSAGGYNTNEVNVTIFINKVNSEITLQNIESVYANGDISIYATMLKIIDPLNPKPNNYGNLEYFIYNGSILKISGSLILLMSGVYSTEISLGNLPADVYTVYINGTAFNCEDAQSNVVNLTIIPQNPTELEIVVPNTIRILKEFEIRTTLKYSENETIIPYQVVYLNVSVGSDSFLVNTITGADGVSTYEYIISAEYEGFNITIQAIYMGQEKIASSETSVNKVIQGKIPIILEFIAFPNNTARVGYSATFKINISIMDPGEDVQNRIILFSSYYDDDSSPFTTQQLYTDENGECGFTIPELADGKTNLTTYFEFLGSTTIAYNLSYRTDVILPKWNSDYGYTIIDADDDGVYRYGEEIIFNMTFWSPDFGAPSFSGLPTVFTFNFDSISDTSTQFVTGNNTIWYLFSIPDSFNDNNLNITIDFQGSHQVNNKTISFTVPVADKITAEINFEGSISTRYVLGAYAISVNVTTSDGNPLSNVKLDFKLLDSSGQQIDGDSIFTNDEGIATVTLGFSKEGKNCHITVDIDDSYGYYQVPTLISGNIKITTAFMAFLEDYGLIILISTLVIASIYLVMTFGYVKPKRKKKRAFLKQMYQKLSDVENIQYCLILTKDGGVPVFSKSLAEVPIDESLVSGFLSAISSFGAEIGSKIQKADGGLEELSYKQFKIILNEGNYVRVALLLLRKPNDSLKAKLKSFNDIFEETFKERLVRFSGEIFDDVQVTKLMEENFETHLLYPHQVIQTRANSYIKEVSKKDVAKRIIIIAQGYEFESTFYLREMINHLKTKGIEEVKSFESLERLKENKIVFAINPRTSYLIEQFQRYINSMDTDDRSILFAIFDGNDSLNLISKYLKKRQIQLSRDLDRIVEHLRVLKVIDGFNINDTGTVVATLLKLIPDL